MLYKLNELLLKTDPVPGSMPSAAAATPPLPPEPADQPTSSSSHRAPGGASLPARCPPSLQVCGLQWQMALASPVVPTHTFQWDFPLNSKQRTRLNSQSCKNVFKIVFHWSPVTSRAILCEFLRALDKHIFWISSQVPGKISELCFDMFFSFYEQLQQHNLIFRISEVGLQDNKQLSELDDS